MRFRCGFVEWGLVLLLHCACGLFLLRQRNSRNLKCMQISKWKAKSQRMLTVVWDFPRPGTPGCYTVPLGPCPPGTSGNADLMSPCGGSTSHQPPAAAGENRILGLAARVTLLSPTPGVCCSILLSIMTHKVSPPSFMSLLLHFGLAVYPALNWPVRMF